MRADQLPAKHQMDEVFSSNEKVVKEGTYLYDGTVKCDIRIVYSPILFGAGDYADPPELSDDQDVDTYYVWFGSTTERGKFNAGGAGYASLEEAIQGACSIPGIGSTIRWKD